MTAAAKIRLLLALLFASLLFMAVMVQNNYSPKKNLEQTASTLENNIQKKEQFIHDRLAEPGFLKRLKTLPDSATEAFKVIETFTSTQGIWVTTYKNNHLLFWSGIKVVPKHPEGIHPGYSFKKEDNGFYETFRKDDGDFSVIFQVPVKIAYAFQNKYLRNRFSTTLTTDDNIDIADFTDKEIRAIHTIDNSYLFSVKLVSNEVNERFFYFEATLYLLSFLVLVLLVNDAGNYIAHKGYPILAVLFIAMFIVAARFINLAYGWPDFASKLLIFNPQLYASSKVFPSFGDFSINILLLSWLTVFAYRQQEDIAKIIVARVNGYIVVVLSVLGLIAVSTSLLRLFYGVVINSRINFDVNNVLNLSGYSMVGVLMLCFGFLIFYLLDELLLCICLRLKVPLSHQTILLALGVVISTAVFTIFYEFTLFYLLWFFIVVIRAFSWLHRRRQLTAINLAIILFICALISSIKLNHFQSIKESGHRLTLIDKLATTDDMEADMQLKRAEARMMKDPTIVQFFDDTTHIAEVLQNYFERTYFDGYLSRYEFTPHVFNRNGAPIASDVYDLSIFKDMILYNSLTKVSHYFYRQSEQPGTHEYLGLLPVFNSSGQVGTVVISLTTRPQQASNSFPELLAEGENNPEDEFKNYSYAFYYDGRLVSQSGKFVYSVLGDEFKAPLKTYQFTTTYNATAVWRSNASWVDAFNKFSHLVYRPNSRAMIVVSREENIIAQGITSLTFFFILFLVFTVIIIILRWFWTRVRIAYVKDNLLQWGFKFNFDRILYKTRIQFSMVFTVVFTLLLVGFITYLTISRQYQTQQDDIIRDKIKRISQAFGAGMFTHGVDHITPQDRISFDQYARANSADLVLFNTEGVPVISTQPKMYTDGIVAPRINSRALLYLKKLHRSEFINDEKVGELNYKAAYAPLAAEKRQGPIGYLELPYFSNESDYRERIGTLLNAMINIYALVFIAIGMFAVITARQITSPLSFIQYSLSKTIYGKKNEAIKWERDDEIGALVKEYNKMIAALENSAQKLAQSERETAWREMAKQVAHEIKNPLTPLKLGLQLLEKSWKDKDPRFDQKFERFSKSFVEQIESLSSIASEFSAFAKMPDTKIERINIFEMLSQAVIIFRQMDNVKILYQPPADPFIVNADRDQILRCFNNLLKNAIEATPTDKLVIIDIAYQLSDKSVLLSIRDNGNGIPENMREKIFEPNFTTKSSGTGLGLAFVKNSIENAGGKVWFETEAEVGTTFYLSFPIAS